MRTMPEGIGERQHGTGGHGEGGEIVAAGQETSDLPQHDLHKDEPADGQKRDSAGNPTRPVQGVE